MFSSKMIRIMKLTKCIQANTYNAQWLLTNGMCFSTSDILKGTL